MRGLSRVTLSALAVVFVSALAFAGPTGVVQGKVTAVSEKAVSVVDEDGTVWNFEVSQGAQVYASGATHKSQMLISSGSKTTMDDFVREGPLRERALPGAGRRADPHQGARSLTGRDRSPAPTALNRTGPACGGRRRSRKCRRISEGETAPTLQLH